MRKHHNEESLAASRIKRGRAILVGYGLDDAAGHLRFTRGDSMELYGGSREAHEEMQRRAAAIQGEAARLGISLEGMTYEQYLVMRDVVERMNCEPTQGNL